MPSYDGLPLEELERAEHMDEIVGEDGTRYRVLVSMLDDSKTVVRADVVEYSSLWDHPLVRGVISGLALVGALTFPVLAAAYYAPSFGSGVGSMLIGFVLFMNLLNRGGAAGEIERMLEWKEISGMALQSRTGEMS